jgi:hypothetical protein
MYQGNAAVYRLALLSVSVGLAHAAPASAQTYFVSPRGNDDASGRSPARAWRTVARVDRARLEPGDVVLFAAGATFTDTTLIPPASGAAGAPIRFGSYGRGRAVISNAGGAVWFDARRFLSFDHLTLTTNGAASVILAGSTAGSSDITVRDCLLANTADAAINSPSRHDSDWLIADSTIEDTGDSGLILLGSNDIVRGNSIRDVGRNRKLDYGKHGIYAKGPDVLVEDNTISHFPGSGISVRLRDARLVDNEISDGPTAISFFRQGRLVGDSTIEDNELSDISAAGFYYDGGGENFVVSGNRIAMSGGAAFSIAGTPSRNLTIAGNTVTGTPAYALEMSSFSDGATYVEHGNRFVGAPVFGWDGRRVDLREYQALSGQGGGDELIPAPAGPPLDGGLIAAAVAASACLLGIGALLLRRRRRAQ